jgi:hypothetical protein
MASVLDMEIPIPYPDNPKKSLEIQTGFHPMEWQQFHHQLLCLQQALLLYTDLKCKLLKALPHHLR